MADADDVEVPGNFSVSSLLFEHDLIEKLHGPDNKEEST